jgi:soluble lytic murein transglycosylase-like protein
MKILFIMAICVLSLLAKPSFDEYFIESGNYFGVPPLLLKKIATIESSLNPNCINYNKNKTIDYGIMQINSCHFAELEKIGIKQEMIMAPRINIFAGAYLVAKQIKRGGYNLEAIGMYHSATPMYKQKWNSKLANELAKELKSSY